jgi:hypothetical protein
MAVLSLPAALFAERFAPSASAAVAPDPAPDY